MKKKLLMLFFCILLFALIILPLLMFKKEKTFYLNDEYYGSSSLIEIDINKLKALEESKKSFVVFVYQSYCSTSYDLDSILTEFVDTYKINFYKIPFPNIKDTSIASYVKYCPSVVIYHDGKIVVYLDASSDKDTDYYESIENFRKWFTKYVVLK